MFHVEHSECWNNSIVKSGKMDQPRILIPIPTSFDHAYNAKSWPEYAAAVRQAGGEPIEVALTHTIAELQALAATAEGILLPGSGADVDPARYGHDRQPECAEADGLREQTDRALLEAAEHSRIPLLGICLGLQSLNVFHGGTLIQDLDPLPVNHRAGRAVAAAHTAVFARDSRLGEIIGKSQEVAFDDEAFARIPVNSSHHQAVGTPGESLRIAARCPDDSVIEALEGSDPEHWLLGVQWHPERTTDSSEASRAIFRGFIHAAKNR
jgi:putative glutamine amidotransferase